MAAAYLTICAGTGKGNRVSRWSAVAIQNHTGLAWKRGKPAIAQLVADGFISMDHPSSTAARPVYELQPFDVVLNAARRRLSDWDHSIVEALRVPKRLSKSRQADAPRLAMLGLIWQEGDTFSADPPTKEGKENFIWLPNSIVVGTVKGEASPLKRLRQIRNLDALRLLVDLYSAHDLADDGGVSRNVAEGLYRRKRYGHCGNRFVWGFTRRAANAYFGEDSTRFFWQRKTVTGSTELGLWPTLSTLLQMGLLTRVPHLVENEDRGSEPIIGVAWDSYSGEPQERAVAVAANEAARRMLPDVIMEHGAEDEDVLVPVWQTMPNVQMVDIYRLRYRPHTEPTSRWFRQLNESASVWIQDYQELTEYYSDAARNDRAASG